MSNLKLIIFLKIIIDVKKQCELRKQNDKYNLR
jgi:hypothetical protein